MSGDAAVVSGVLVLPLGHPAIRVFAAALRQARFEAHRNGLPVDPRLGVLLDLLGAESPAVPAVPNAEPKFGANGSAGRALVEVAASLMSTADVAAAAGCSSRSVSKAALRGRLAGQRNRHGCWEFRPQDVQTWCNRRKSRQAEGTAL